MDTPQAQRLLSSIENTRYAVFAAATIMLYDHFFNAQRRRTSFINNVFLWHRYFGLFCIMFELSVVVNTRVTESVRYIYINLSPNDADETYVISFVCSFWLRWEILSISVSILTSELVLMSWIYVIYDRNILVVVLLLCLYAGEVVTTFTILGVSLDHAHSEAKSVVLGHPAQPKRKQLLYDVYKNSAMNYVTMFSAYLLCCILWISADFSLARIPVMFALCFSIMNATRLLLNVRYVYFTHTSSRINVRSDSDDSVLAGFDGTEERWMYELRELRWSGPSGLHA
ncbi:uncharacterized protein BT62DRAFT_1005760 [Guyanagaster necrorhizus]|uniref:Uncharacterized protein n=1 Tax=Guyanagaster necrorhizus TaxID=856835 RepID=A0A9P8ASL7_9AGAR|nr:uncharacterized protein BT62DRAFT_1005760 [Guyanagaster necrorhizus MCA 3950]KAG7446464.1 hypothetical protein BT62DRAFT_1005760 [Guyanagaster necrorhizus MCA 3950]